MSDSNYIKHVVCEGARFHVIYWDTNGRHCSEPKCIINKGSKDGQGKKIYIRQGKQG